MKRNRTELSEADTARTRNAVHHFASHASLSLSTVEVFFALFIFFIRLFVLRYNSWRGDLGTFRASRIIGRNLTIQHSIASHATRYPSDTKAA
jgi:hypothetical protein